MKKLFIAFLFSLIVIVFPEDAKAQTATPECPAQLTPDPSQYDYEYQIMCWYCFPTATPASTFIPIPTGIYTPTVTTPTPWVTVTSTPTSNRTLTFVSLGFPYAGSCANRVTEYDVQGSGTNTIIAEWYVQCDDTATWNYGAITGQFNMNGDYTPIATAYYRLWFREAYPYEEGDGKTWSAQGVWLPNVGLSYKTLTYGATSLPGGGSWVGQLHGIVQLCVSTDMNADCLVHDPWSITPTATPENIDCSSPENYQDGNEPIVDIGDLIISTGGCATIIPAVDFGSFSWLTDQITDTLNVNVGTIGWEGAEICYDLVTLPEVSVFGIDINLADILAVGLAVIGMLLITRI